MKTIKDIINDMTAEEREHFKDLIEESRQRENEINERKQNISQLIEKLNSSMSKLSVSLDQLYLKSSIIDQKLKQIHNSTQSKKLWVSSKKTSNLVN